MNNIHVAAEKSQLCADFGSVPQIKNYLVDLVRLNSEKENLLVAVVVFGSAAIGGYSTQVSDVDLLLIIRDGASEQERDNLQRKVSELEKRHGIVKPQEHPHGVVGSFIARLTANVRSFFICTRDDLLSGDSGRILGIPKAQALFVDRIAVASIITSGKIIYGENILSRVPLQPIRRFDVIKAFFGLFNQLLLITALYPMIPAATKYAMDTLKRSVHNCYFCYHLRPEPLATEVAFFRKSYGQSKTLTQLMRLRNEYSASLRFVVNCLPALMMLHLRAARDNSFPRNILNCAKKTKTKMI